MFSDGADARRFKAVLTLRAFREVTKQLVLRSWHITGILKYLLKDTQEVYNGYNEALVMVNNNRGGEVPLQKLEVVDSDDDVDGAIEEKHDESPQDCKRQRFEEKMAQAVAKTEVGSTKENKKWQANLRQLKHRLIEKEIKNFAQ